MEELDCIIRGTKAEPPCFSMNNQKRGAFAEGFFSIIT
jgi:hypothetical protein